MGTECPGRKDQAVAHQSYQTRRGQPEIKLTEPYELGVIIQIQYVHHVYFFYKVAIQSSRCLIPSLYIVTSKYMFIYIIYIYVYIYIYIYIFIYSQKHTETLLLTLMVKFVRDIFSDALSIPLL